MTLIRILGKIAKKFPANIQSILRYWYWRSIQKNQCGPRKTLQFEVHLTDHCNLNCAGCCHFSPIAQQYFIDCKSFELDRKRLHELTNGHIERIHLMGGEPLLHPQCVETIAIAGKYFGNGIIEIVTNGILLLEQSKKFWETCKKNKATIIITNYPIKRDDESIKQLAGQYNIGLEYWGGAVKTFDCIPLDLNGSQEQKESFKRCRTKNLCIQLKDGKLYTCHTAAYIEIFNQYFGQNLLAGEKDYIDIYKAKNMQEILDFLSRPIPFCRYCDTTKSIVGMKWGISKKKIEEWV